MMNLIFLLATQVHAAALTPPRRLPPLSQHGTMPLSTPGPLAAALGTSLPAGAAPAPLLEGPQAAPASSPTRAEEPWELKNGAASLSPRFEAAFGGIEEDSRHQDTGPLAYRLPDVWGVAAIDGDLYVNAERVGRIRSYLAQVLAEAYGRMGTSRRAPQAMVVEGAFRDGRFHVIDLYPAAARTTPQK